MEKNLKELKPMLEKKLLDLRSAIDGNSKNAILRLYDEINEMIDFDDLPADDPKLLEDFQEMWMRYDVLVELGNDVLYDGDY